MSSDNQRARASMRALIDRKDAPINLRIEAISSLNSDRATQEDVKYLKDLYTRAESDAMKRAVIDAVGRMGSPETDQWILSIARNNNESSSIRATAMSRLVPLEHLDCRSEQAVRCGRFARHPTADHQHPAKPQGA
jgi:hypothetical protein